MEKKNNIEKIPGNPIISIEKNLLVLYKPPDWIIGNLNRSYSPAPYTYTNTHTYTYTWTIIYIHECYARNLLSIEFKKK